MLAKAVGNLAQMLGQLTSIKNFPYGDSIEYSGNVAISP